MRIDGVTKGLTTGTDIDKMKEKLLSAYYHLPGPTPIKSKKPRR